MKILFAQVSHEGRDRSLPRAGAVGAFAPLPLTQHPAAVYLSQLAPKSRRTMRQSLNAISSMLTNGTCDAMTLDWSKLRYQHTAALSAVFRISMHQRQQIECCQHCVVCYRKHGD
jgi:hypothetical protein